MKKLILTMGLPRSGKSTWAQSTTLPIVNRDSIRLSLHGMPFLEEAEEMVTTIENLMVKSLFAAGHHTVIIDACHITKKRRDRWKRVIPDAEIEVASFLTSSEVCIDRAFETGKIDLVAVIKRMEKSMEPLSEDEKEF